MKQPLAVKSALFMIAISTVAIAHTARVSAQTESADWERTAEGKLSFEVASVKPNDSGPGRWGSSNSVFDLGDKRANGVVRATNLPLITYIAFAYKLDVIETRAVSMQLPQWTRRPFYDIEAQLTGNNFTKDQVRLAMQSLLADRFKMTLHFETKNGPAYALVLARPGKLGSGMRAYPDGIPCSEAPAGGARGIPSVVPTVDGGRLPASCGQIQALPTTEAGNMREAGRNVSMDMLFDTITIEGNLDRPIVDRSGLSGTFDVSVEFLRPSLPVAGAFGAHDFREALGDQLGLKLEPITAPVRSPIVDNIEQLTPN